MKAGWKTVKLEELIEVQNGYAFSSKDYSDSGHFLMRIGNVQNGQITTSDPKYVQLPPDGSLNRFSLVRGDILVSLTGNVGRVGVISDEHLPAALNQRVARITPRSHAPISREFLLHFLGSDSFREQLSDAGRGSAQQNVSTKDLIALEIPLPPLAEQKRIVALLDEAFAGIDAAKAKASASLENGIALFHSYLNSVFAHCGETWIEKPLDEVLVKTETIDPARTPRAEFDYIDVSSVSKEELVVQQTQRLLGKDAPSRARKLVRANDVIFATIRPTLRRIAIVPAELDGQVCSTGYFVLRPKGEIDHRWVFYFLQTDTFLAEMERLQKGASYPAVTDKDVRSQMIPMPSLGTQKEALEKLDDLRKETLTVSKLYEKKVLNLTELKSALLAQAFAGELIA